MLRGRNTLEGSLFLLPLFKELHGSKSADAIYNSSAELLREQVAAFIRTEVGRITSKEAVELFLNLSQVTTDILYKYPPSLVSKASTASHNPKWCYLFNVTFPDTQALLALPKYGLNNVGAFHSSEIPIMFGTYGAFEHYTPSTPDQVALSRYMMTAWADFTKEPEKGPEWTKMRGRRGDIIACLLCDKNLGGMESVNGDELDLNSLFMNVLYPSNTPLF